jgi:hypothetical protein
MQGVIRETFTVAIRSEDMEEITYGPLFHIRTFLFWLLASFPLFHLAFKEPP